MSSDNTTKVPSGRHSFLPVNHNFSNKDIISLEQFLPSDMEVLFSLTKEMKAIVDNGAISNILTGKIVTLLFYEPSSRTFGSFVSAVKKLGGETLDIINPQQFSSVAKGETFQDTIRVFETYSDCIVIRHFREGSAESAAKVANKPIINAGDGVGEHPTQALLDLYTIFEKHNNLENLIGVISGDLLNGRTVHSLLKGLSLYKNNTVYLLSPKELKLSARDLHKLKRKIKLIEITSENEIPDNAHFWYWTRIQKERFIVEGEYNKVKNSFVLSRKLLNKKGNSKLILMHPLPRVGEIETDIDEDPRAVYLTKQIKNGLYVRMALLTLVLSRET